MHVSNGASRFQGVKALHKVSMWIDACSVLHRRLELRRLPGNLRPSSKLGPLGEVPALTPRQGQITESD